MCFNVGDLPNQPCLHHWCKEAASPKGRPSAAAQACRGTPAAVQCRAAASIPPAAAAPCRDKAHQNQLAEKEQLVAGPQARVLELIHLPGSSCSSVLMRACKRIPVRMDLCLRVRVLVHVCVCACMFACACMRVRV